MDTPFAFDKIPCGNGVIGRSAEIDCILSSLGPSGKSIAVYGGARSGKETLVTEAIERYRNHKKNLIVCEFDLLGVRSSDAFVHLWREKMRECAVEVNRGALLPFEIRIDEIPENKIFDLPGIIANEASAQMIIYFKEFQNLLLCEDDSFRLEDLDRAWSRQHAVRYILTGSFINAMKSIFEERRCFYSLCRTLELKPIDKKTVCEYIRGSFLRYGRVIEMEEALAIYEITSGNMWYVNQLCAFCHAMPAGYVNRKIVNQARDILLSIHIPRFKQTLYDLTGNQVSLLHAVADGERKFSSAESMERYRLNSSAGVARVKEALRKKEVITFDSEDNARIIDPLFEYWLKNYYFA